MFDAPWAEDYSLNCIELFCVELQLHCIALAVDCFVLYCNYIALHLLLRRLGQVLGNYRESLGTSAAGRSQGLLSVVLLLP